MPVVNVNLLLDDATYDLVKMGKLELCGMVKDNSKKIRKHLPAVADAAKDGASKAIDLIRNHKKETLIIGGFIVVGGATFGIVDYFTGKEKRKSEKELVISLEKYLEAAKNGKLTSEILDELILNVEMASKYSKDGSIPIKLSSRQLNAFFFNIYDFTKRMADANEVKVKIKAPNVFKKNTIIDLKDYLTVQKEIIKKAA